MPPRTRRRRIHKASPFQHRVGTVMVVVLAIGTVQKCYQQHHRQFLLFLEEPRPTSRLRPPEPSLSNGGSAAIPTGRDTEQTGPTADIENAIPLLLVFQHSSETTTPTRSWPNRTERSIPAEPQHFKEQTIIEPQQESLHRSLEFYEKELFEITSRFYRPQQQQGGADKKEQQRLQLDIVSAVGRAALLEMEDGREMWCLDSYYNLWSKQQPFSGQPFFEWLDRPKNSSSGATSATTTGALPETESCSRHALNLQRYAKFNQTQIEASEIELRPFRNMLVQAVFVQSQQPVPDGTWLLVWDMEERLYLVKDDYIRPTDVNDTSCEYYRHGHCSITHGRPVLFAGEMGIAFYWGIVIFTNPQSGHYRPRAPHTLQFYHWMQRQVGGDLARTRVEWRPCESCGYDTATTRTNATRAEWAALFH